MDNIKRNKKITASIEKQLKRLKIESGLDTFITTFVSPYLVAQDTIELSKHKKIDYEVFNIEGVLLESLKIIGLMEISKDETDLKKLISKRSKHKEDKKEVTDFDKILKGIMKVPGKKEKSSEK